VGDVQQESEYQRYCPGEERIRISDAVCRGRRRVNFPKCKGCRFNDDERGGAQVSAEPGPGPAARVVSPVPVTASPAGAEPAAARVDRIEEVFRAYDVRGLYPEELNADIAWRIGHAAAQFLRSVLRGYDRSLAEKSAVVVGRDMRRSSPELAAALIEGLRTGGSPVIDIGLIDTPQLAFAVNQLTCCGGVQVTASHNPARYNGFKFCGLKGRPISSDTGLTKISRIARNTQRHVGGQLSGLREQDLGAAYKAYVLGFLRPPEGGRSSRRPLRVVVDASNGMAGRWFPIIFGDVDWLDIVRLNFEHNGDFIHDPDPLVRANLGQLIDRMGRSRADFGVCFDGDADRCVFVDHEGRVIEGDVMTALLARRFLAEAPGSVVVYDVRCSRLVAEEIRQAGGIPRRERCGHAFIKKAMADSKAVFGGELSGHYYFRDNFYSDSAMIAFAEVAGLVTSSGKPLAELAAPLRRYARSGERNFRNDDHAAALKRLARRYGDARIDHLDGLTVEYDDWWFNVRSSNTEPILRLNLEARSPALLEDRLAELVPLLGEPLT